MIDILLQLVCCLCLRCTCATTQIKAGIVEAQFQLVRVFVVLVSHTSAAQRPAFFRPQQEVIGHWEENGIFHWAGQRADGASQLPALVDVHLRTDSDFELGKENEKWKKQLC